MKLSDVLSRAGVEGASVEGEADVTSVASDSRRVSPGSLFVCMPSRNTDSHTFLGAAAGSGATAAVVHSLDGRLEAHRLGLAVAFVPNEGLRFNEAVWRIAKLLFGNPSAAMKVAGITGTNGKTTTAWLLRDMLAALGERAGYLGTLGLQWPGHERLLENTTPFAIELTGLIAEARDAGVTSLAMEVSSHALEQRRSDGIEFDAAVFTNLTQDHLDFHGSMDSYAAAKLRLFSEYPSLSGKRFVAAINVDDPVGARWAREASGPVIRYGSSGDLIGEPLEVEVDRLTLRLKTGGDCIDVRAPLGGSFNVQNCLSASAGLLALGYSLADVAKALPKVRPVPGRFEAVPNDRGIGIIVDYAHTPDALEKLLESTRALRHEKIITVFGCGGDRDRAKRPKMARAASERSDLTVVTSDNPRTEDPAAILAEVASGVAAGRDSVQIIDRREAIGFAISQANPGDIVVIAGKGHENYQIIGRTKYPMDDRQLAREGLEARP